MRLAIVEDDPGVGDALVAALRAKDYQADHLRRGADLLLTHDRYDAVILDLGLPDMDGLEVLRKLREVSSVPVLILTARSGERAVIRGLRAGADDYLTKPPRVGELVARLETVTRRAGTPAAPPQLVVVTGDVRVDLQARTVEVAGAPITLTHKEFELVRVLLERPGSAVSRQQLMDRIWGDAFAAISRALDVHMAALRAKLQRPHLITTIRGYGYRWETEPPDP
ncbi:response regulator transcription factor [Nocardia amikacinitolerans]|uniref:response regulator transcription factor n=1 Tax=Nocardia amikacinitolerans TaxID=756689 RepID=UPI0020A28B92|nr:response regulator transcription factor [Nocardia amikacinitolerans]MCP2289332.1 DNA-binding response regulator, OmpR family, contains REC and winged-helix (wHTH) domain [Nocardia amikacinitolerans]